MSSSGASVQAILQELQAGIAVEENFRRLVDLYHRPLYRFFTRHGFSPQDCLDLTQETFLGIYRGIASFRGDARFETWLYRVATNAWRKRLRQALAAALLAATIGLSVWVASLRRTVDELSRPQVNAPVIDLYSGTVRSEGAAMVRVIPREARVFTLILNPVSARKEKEYRIEVVRADGSRAWSAAGLKPNAYGSLSLTLTRRALGAGDFRIRLYGEESLIAEYALRVEGP